MRDRPGPDPARGVPPGVAERLVVPWTPGNSGRGKGPQFKAQSGRGRQPGDWREPIHSTYRLGDSGTSARAAVNQPTLTAEWEDRDYTGLVREPDAGNPPVRFDERGVEAEYGHPTMPPRHTSTLLLILAASPFLLPVPVSAPWAEINAEKCQVRTLCSSFQDFLY